MSGFSSGCSIEIEESASGGRTSTCVVHVFILLIHISPVEFRKNKILIFRSYLKTQNNNVVCNLPFLNPIIWCAAHRREMLHFAVALENEWGVWWDEGVKWLGCIQQI
jgi:hypothetical protein